jgi:soluble lytic murein transglycosylase-like protein
MHIFFMCLSMLGTPESREFRPRMTTCIEVGQAAEVAHEDPALVLAMAWYESRFVTKAESAKGAVGPLQVIPAYWCPDGTRKGCDYVKAGLRALQAYKSKHRKMVEVLCHYNAGNVCWERSYDHARKVLRKAKSLRRWM